MTTELHDNTRRALGRVYALLLRLAEEAAEGDTLEAIPDSTADTGGLHRCTIDDSTSAAARQIEGCNG
jgi:hypothetical protein